MCQKGLVSSVPVIGYIAFHATLFLFQFKKSAESRPLCFFTAAITRFLHVLTEIFLFNMYSILSYCSAFYQVKRTLQ